MVQPAGTLLRKDWSWQRPVAKEEAPGEPGWGCLPASQKQGSVQHNILYDHLRLKILVRSRCLLNVLSHLAALLSILYGEDEALDSVF